MRRLLKRGLETLDALVVKLGLDRHSVVDHGTGAAIAGITAYLTSGIYVTLHEALHSIALKAMGQEVAYIGISEATLPFADVIRKVVPFYGSEAHGGLSGVVYSASNLSTTTSALFLAAPYAMTPLGIALVRNGYSRRKWIQVGFGLPFAFSPFFQMHSDRDIGNISKNLFGHYSSFGSLCIAAGIIAGSCALVHVGNVLKKKMAGDRGEAHSISMYAVALSAALMLPFSAATKPEAKPLLGRLRERYDEMLEKTMSNSPMSYQDKFQLNLAGLRDFAQAKTDAEVRAKGSIMGIAYVNGANQLGSPGMTVEEIIKQMEEASDTILSRDHPDEYLNLHATALSRSNKTAAQRYEHAVSVISTLSRPFHEVDSTRSVFFEHLISTWEQAKKAFGEDKVRNEFSDYYHEFNFHAKLDNYGWRFSNVPKQHVTDEVLLDILQDVLVLPPLQFVRSKKPVEFILQEAVNRNMLSLDDLRYVEKRLYENYVARGN